MFGIVGALYPALVVTDRTDLHTPRWNPATSCYYVWGFIAISYGALALAGGLRIHHGGRRKDSQSTAGSDPNRPLHTTK